MLYMLGGAQKDIKESFNSGCPWGVDLMARGQKRELCPGLCSPIMQPLDTGGT